MFDASALINSEITHLTSIRVRGSPGSSNQIIRSRRGKGFHCHSLRRSFLLHLLPSLCSSTSCPSSSPFKASSSPLVSVLLSSLIRALGSRVLQERQKKKGRPRRTHTPAAPARRAPESAPNLTQTSSSGVGAAVGETARG